MSTVVYPVRAITETCLFPQSHNENRRKSTKKKRQEKTKSFHFPERRSYRSKTSPYEYLSEGKSKNTKRRRRAFVCHPKKRTNLQIFICPVISARKGPLLEKESGKKGPLPQTKQGESRSQNAHSLHVLVKNKKDKQQTDADGSTSRIKGKKNRKAVWQDHLR